MLPFGGYHPDLFIYYNSLKVSVDPVTFSHQLCAEQTSMNKPPGNDTVILPCITETSPEMHRRPGAKIPDSARSRQINLSMLSNLIFPWISTIIFVASVIALVRAYEQKGVMTPSEKDIFNIVSTALILFLALSFYVSCACTNSVNEPDGF